MISLEQMPEAQLPPPSPSVQAHPVVRAMAKFISYIFHPLFIPIYVILFFLYEIRMFPDRDAWGKKLILIQFLVSYTLLPLVTILLMKGLGFIQSFQLHSRRDRIMPYVVCEIFYFWTWYVARNLHYPKVVIAFALAVFLSSAAGLILNSYMKISMHGLAVGTLCAAMVMTGLTVHFPFGMYVSAAVLIAGLTCTARLIDSDHYATEVYTGFIVGVLMQVIGWWFA